MSVPPPPPRRRARDVQPTYVPPPSPPRVDPAARAPRRADEHQQGASARTTVIVVAVLAAIVLIGAGVIVALGGGDSNKSDKAVDTSTTVELEAGALIVESVDPFKSVPEQFTPEVRDAVIDQLGVYVDAATVSVLRKGAIKDTEIASVFDDAAILRLGSTDRAVLLDEGLPKATGKLTVETPPVPLFALSDATGKILVVEAQVDFDIRAEAAGGEIVINRTGVLMFTQQADGTWKITSWILGVERDGPGVTADTTVPTTATTVPA